MVDEFLRAWTKNFKKGCKVLIDTNGILVGFDLETTYHGSGEFHMTAVAKSIRKILKENHHIEQVEHVQNQPGKIRSKPRIV